MSSRGALLAAAACALALAAYASVFGTVRAIVHDPQHRPIANAEVRLRGKSSSWSRTTKTNRDGIVQLQAVPIGDYQVEINAAGFGTARLFVTAESDRTSEIHASLRIATVQQSLQITAASEKVNSSSAIPQVQLSREQIAQTPGADRTNSLSFITDFVPGAYVVHDQLHIRGGHQVTWAVDGVPVPNTNIATNVGPQFDPKDVDYMEVQRGSFLADYGERTYGFFNIAPRSGFERNHEAELIASYGSFQQTDNQISFGDHTDRFGYYVSANGNRTDYGLETPEFSNLHNQANGVGAFTSLTYNSTRGDQYRFVGAARGDYYQVPNTAEMQGRGVRGGERERDVFANFTYLHSFNSSMVFTLTPFLHFNRATLEGGPKDVPSTTDDHSSTYAGGQVSISYASGRHNAKAGLYAFAQYDNALFGVVANDGSGAAFRERNLQNGDLEALFVEDQFKAFSWLTLSAGARFTRFSGGLYETAASPRVGAALRIPKISWVLRASYSRFYQPPPLSTITGPLLDFAAIEGAGFLPLRGERDEQHDFGLTIPISGWAFDFDYFRTSARNFFDHEALGNSNIFFPLSIDRVRTRGFENVVRSPRLFGRAELHLAYSHQSIEGQGGVTGGMTDFSPPTDGFFYLDHDQRNTLTVGFRTDLPFRSWLAANLNYGSGFLDGDGPEHLPSHRTVDVAVGKSFGQSWSAKVTATNLGDSRYFIDLSNTFGGSHTAEPRMLTVQVCYRFHY